MNRRARKPKRDPLWWIDAAEVRWHPGLYGREIMACLVYRDVVNGRRLEYGRALPWPKIPKDAKYDPVIGYWVSPRGSDGELEVKELVRGFLTENA